MAFASAPGTPNWQGLLRRVREDQDRPAHDFDILHVVDAARAWYQGQRPVALVLPCLQRGGWGPE